MTFFKGILYNLKGLWLGLKTPRLLFLGLFRLLAVVVLTVLTAGLVLVYHQELLGLVWSEPQSAWIRWLWYVVSWLLTLFLVGLSTIFAYLISQMMFSVVIMDYMSRITERIITGKEKKPPEHSLLKRFLFLFRQEVPRAFLPLVLIFLIMMLGWLTPLGPFLAVVSSGVSVIFLAWDNTDLVPARRLEPFGRRFKSLINQLPFHLGFGLLFLIPGLNMLFLSFAPVGATLYAVNGPLFSKKPPQPH
jgi:CysZ protein